MEIYRFKVYNTIGNILTIGKMAAPKDEVIAHCKKAIEDARKFTNSIYQYEVELVTPLVRIRTPKDKI